jgi:hypothetical protein
VGVHGGCRRYHPYSVVVEMSDQEHFTTDQIEQSLAKLMGLLGVQDKSDVRVVTEVSESEILGLSNLKMMNSGYGKSEDIETFITNFLLLRISKKRRGRKEILSGLISIGKAFAEKIKGKLGR